MVGLDFQIKPTQHIKQEKQILKQEKRILKQEKLIFKQEKRIFIQEKRMSSRLQLLLSSSSLLSSKDKITSLCVTYIQIFPVKYTANIYSKWSLAQNLDFLRALDFFGLSKSQDFVPGPFRNLELAAFSDLAG
jgi:hypothetical protein